MELPTSLVVALQTSDELGVMLERADLTDPQQCLWVLAQAQMLSHWAELAGQETPCYPALTAGLVAFAAAVSEQVRGQAA